MMKRDDRRPIWSRNKKRPRYVETRPQLEDLRTLSQWFLTIPVVMLLLFSCGQAGILTSQKIAETDIQTNMQADYGPWAYVLIHSIRPEIINEIIRDKPMEDGGDGTIPGTSEGNRSWVDSTPNATTIPQLEPTTTPTLPASNQPSPSDTPQQSPSPQPTRTPTQITGTSTTAPPTEPVDNSPTPIYTPTETPPATATPSPTNPPSTEPVTFWMSGESILRGYKLVTSQPSGPSRQDDTSVTFTTDRFAQGSSIEGGASTIHFFATNPSDQSITVDIILEVGVGHRSYHIGDTEITIPSDTSSPTLFEKTFSTLEYNFSTIGTLNLTVSGGIQVTIYWDGEWNDSRLMVPPISP